MPVGDGDDPTTLADVIDHENGLWGSVFQSIAGGFFAEQRLDIRRMLSAMPDDLRQTYQALSENSVSGRNPSWAFRAQPCPVD